MGRSEIVERETEHCQRRGIENRVAYLDRRRTPEKEHSLKTEAYESRRAKDKRQRLNR